jgi:hypothetical protein
MLRLFTPCSSSGYAAGYAHRENTPPSAVSRAPAPRSGPRSRSVLAQALDQRARTAFHHMHTCPPRSLFSGWRMSRGFANPHSWARRDCFSCRDTRDALSALSRGSERTECELTEVIKTPCDRMAFRSRPGPEFRSGLPTASSPQMEK